MMSAQNRVLAVATATTLLLFLASNSPERETSDRLRPQLVSKMPTSRRLCWTLNIFWAGDPTTVPPPPPPPPPPPAANKIPNPPPASSPKPPPKGNPWDNPSSFDSASQPSTSSSQTAAYTAPRPSPPVPEGSYSNQVGGRGGPTSGGSAADSASGGDSATSSAASDPQETLAFESVSDTDPSTMETAAFTAPSPTGPTGSYSNQVSGRGGPTSSGSAADSASGGGSATSTATESQLQTSAYASVPVPVTTPAPVQSSPFATTSNNLVDNENENWSTVDTSANSDTSESFVTIWVPAPDIQIVQPAPTPNPVQSSMIQKSHPNEVTHVQVSFDSVIPCSSESDCRPYNQFCSQGTCAECLMGSNVGCRASEVCSIASGGASYCVYRQSSTSGSSTTDTSAQDALPPQPQPQQTKYQNPPDNTYFCGTTFSAISSSCLSSKPCPSTISYQDCEPNEGCFDHPMCKAEYDDVGAGGSTSMAAFAAFGDFAEEEALDALNVEEGAPMWMNTGLLNSGYYYAITPWRVSYLFALALGLLSL